MSEQISFYQPNHASFNNLAHSRFNGTVYDVIRTSHNTILILYSNLSKQDLTSLKVFLAGSLVEHPIQTRSESGRRWLYLVEAPIPQHLLSCCEPLELKITSADWQLVLQVGEEPFPDIDHAKLTLMTLQKNNHLCWIKDWCLYHYYLHGVDLIMLYDNGSDNRDVLTRELCDLAPGLEIRLIDWTFPYTSATQAAALNHCYRALSSRSRYYMNFDLDEYLVYVGRNHLIDYLDQKILPPTSTLTLPGSTVPVIQHLNSPPPEITPLISDFRHQKHYSGLSEHKTIFHYDKDIFVQIHFNEKMLKPPHHKHSDTAQTAHTRKSLRTIRAQLKHFLQEFKAKAKRMICKYLWGTHYYPYKPYLNHYAALTLHYNRGWRYLTNEQSRSVPYNSKFHREDTRMMLMLKLASLPRPQGFRDS